MHWFVLPSSNWALLRKGDSGGGGGRKHTGPEKPWGERPVTYPEYYRVTVVPLDVTTLVGYLVSAGVI